MAGNPNPNRNPNVAPAANKRASGNNNFFRMRNRFNANRDAGPRQSAVSLLIPSGGQSTSYGQSSSSPGESSAIKIGNKCGPYAGWQLYFPKVGNLSKTMLLSRN